jgi:hypothetical protein
MTVWIGEFHATHALCGAPSEAALTAALAALCAGDVEAESCELTLVVDPEGNERQVQGVSFSGGAPAPPSAPEAEPGEEGSAPGGE